MDNDPYRPMTMTPRRDRLRAAKRRYDLTGGQITPVAPHNAVQGNIPSETACSQCEQWRDGRGSRQCLRCPNYRRYQMRATTRDQIIVESIPDAIMEQFADMGGNDVDILDAIHHLPDDLAAIISMRYCGSLSVQSVAGILRISVS